MRSKFSIIAILAIVAVWIESRFEFSAVEELNRTRRHGESGAVEQDEDSRDSKELPRLNKIQNLVASEELILLLTNRLQPLNRAALNLDLLSGQAAELFAENLTVIDIEREWKKQSLNDYLTLHDWQAISVERNSPDGLWSSFLNETAFLELAKFYLIDGNLGKDASEFKTKMGFYGHARLSDGSFAFVKAKVDVTWSDPKDGAAKMQILRWHTKKFQTIHSESKLFKDITSACIDERAISAELASSKHEEMTRKLICGEPITRRKGETYPFFFPEVTLEHPAVSVVDIDGDGFDDFFLGRNHLPSLFFRNLGGGRFEEISSQIGLDIDADVTCSLFADYDNDGDKDVFLGRARQRAMFFENQNGNFVDRTADRIFGDLPFLVSSISAADFDNNGLLDVYFCTYSPIEGSHGTIGRGRIMWPRFFLNSDHRDEFRARSKSSHPYLDLTGPPNLLLENTGFEFVVSRHNSSVQSWHKTFQAAWCDFDRDGDQDLYVCNDFAPDDFYRNDNGDGFVRINDDVGLDQLGFGMGVSWRDYNKDGYIDLYVSNMFSKAGRRITTLVDGIDPRIRQMAQGNHLYENRDGRFKLVSDSGEPQEAVSLTGWSWGGQFADFDNDGYPDIFVANGYYSAPEDVAEKVDL